MRIVVSGGWGYGNLGDDAILDSTIQVLRRRFAGCRIDVLTYDLADSGAHSAPDVHLHYCIHKFVDFGASTVFCPEIPKNYSLWNRIVLKFKFALTEKAAWFTFARQFKQVKDVCAIIKGADLFVMAGGGYFNEKWLSKTRSQLLELKIANDLGIPTYVVGPTIGKFAGPLYSDVKAQFSKARTVVVRDDHSFADAEKMSQRVKLIPDIALSSWLKEPPSRRYERIGVVFNNLDRTLQKKVAAGIASYMSENPAVRVDLIISRLWKYDFIAARGVQRELQALGVCSAIVLSSDFRRLEDELASSALVISENLHGLILAARNMVPVIAINDYAKGSPNYKKFVAFLAQSNSEKYCISSTETAASICALIKDLRANAKETQHRLMTLRNAVADEYATTF